MEDQKPHVAEVSAVDLKQAIQAMQQKIPHNNCRYALLRYRKNPSDPDKLAAVVECALKANAWDLEQLHPKFHALHILNYLNETAQKDFGDEQRFTMDMIWREEPKGRAN